LEIDRSDHVQITFLLARTPAVSKMNNPPRPRHHQSTDYQPVFKAAYKWQPTRYILLHMIKNQLLFALRRLSRHKLTTTINVLGLTFGILSCLVIYLYVSYESSYDKFHKDADRIYRVIVQFTEASGMQHGGPGLWPPFAADLRRESTHFSSITGLITGIPRVLVPEPGKPDRIIPSPGPDEKAHITYADSAYLDFFHYQWLAGNRTTALQKPFSVVLTESEARLYFQQGQPTDWIGRSLVYYDSLKVTVTGIVKDWEHNSDFGFKDLISSNSIEHNNFIRQSIPGWNMWLYDVNVFVKLAPGTTVAQAEKEFPAFYQRHRRLPDDIKVNFSLQPLADIHFNTNNEDTYGRRAHKPTLVALSGIALFILVIAAINFINLSTAQSVLRAKEVGLRKVLGSSRGGLVAHFLVETAIIVFIAINGALLLADPVIAALHGFIPQGVRLHVGDPDTWIFIGVTALVTGGLAGWYPARALSGFLPVVSLRGSGVPQLNSKSYLRKGLIVFQFTVSLLFIIGTIMVGRQIHYMLNTDLGFKKEAIMMIDLPWRAPQNLKGVYAAEIQRLSGVRQVSISTAGPEAAGHGMTNLEFKGAGDVTIDVGMDMIDTNYMSVYGLKLVAGRNFYGSDTARDGSAPGAVPVSPGYRAYILNETAAKALGFKKPADAAGRQVSGLDGLPGPVVGVVRDFHSQNLHEKIKPFFFTTESGAGNLLSVKLSSSAFTADQIKTLMAKMESTFKKLYPDKIFHSRFFDESLEQLYKREQQTAQIMNIAMGIAIFISCMGLFGLAAFTANQRTREIGIRKILGAAVPQLVLLLSREFILLVGLSTLIAAPLSGWAMHRWLQDFAYRTSMPWWIFVLSAIAALAIALLTISFQAIRAATANPVESLKVE
jgi:ABC-type antimicrobial peptide transport system permease subunit